MNSDSNSRATTNEEKKIFEHLLVSKPEEGLFADKEWRQSPQPFFISDELKKSLEQLGHRLHQFNQACELLYRQSVDGRQPSWIAELLERGKSPELIKLARAKVFQGEVARVIRPDLILTDDGFIICELDQIPGGIGLTAWMQVVYSELGYSMLGGKEGMLDGFRSILGGGDIIISEEGATYRPEMLYLTKQLNKKYPDLSWRLLSEHHHGDWQKNIYRFFELFDLRNIPCAPELFEQALEKKLTVTPPLKPQLEEKLWLALFWMKPLRDFWVRHLTQRGFDQLKKIIPYSWILNPEPLPPQAVYPQLEVQSWEEVAEFSQQERDLVIKISGFDERAWGSRGVVIGADVPKTEWKHALQSALNEYDQHPHLMQIFHHSALHTQPYFDEKNIIEMKGRVRLTPYYFVSNEKVTLSGALATICPADKKLLHGMSDAILVPAGCKAPMHVP